MKVVDLAYCGLGLRGIGVIGFVGALGYLAAKSPLLALALPALGACLILLRWPPAGILALVVAGQMLPFSIGTGTETRLNAAVLLLPVLIGLWVLEILARREFPRFPARTILPLIALSGAATLAFVAGVEPWMVFAQTAPIRSQIGELALFFLSAGVFLLAGYQLRDVRWLQALTWLFLVSGALYVAGQLVPGVGHVIATLFARGSDGSLFWVWLPVLSFSQAAFNRRAPLAWRLVLGGVACSTFYMALSQEKIGWTSGWLPAVAAVLVALWAGAPRLGLLVTVASALLVALDPSAVSNLVMAGDNQYSLDTRVEAWTILEKVVDISLVLGLGPANYYWYTPLFPIEGYAVHFNSHNNYVDLIAQTGVLGLACFLWFAAEVGVMGWRLRNRVGEGFERAYVCGAVGGLAGTLTAGMLGDWVLPFVYNIGFTGFRASMLAWLFLGGLVALEQSVLPRSCQVR